MIVVVSIGILSSIAIPRYVASSNDARQNSCNSNVASINEQLELKFVNRGLATYPTPSELYSDTNYYPEGAPKCPMGDPYEDDNLDNRVDPHVHIYTEPIVTTKAPTNVLPASATLNMKYDCLSFSCRVRFQFRDVSVSTWTNMGGANVTGSGTRAYTRSGLNPETNYVYRAQIRHLGVWSSGAIVPVNTGDAGGLPTVSTDGVTDIMPASATFNMTYDFAAYSSGRLRFQMRLQGAPSWTTVRTVTRSGAGSFSYTRSGLLPDSNYEVRAGLQYGTTWMYGSIVAFTTGSAAEVPTIATDPVSDILPASATFNATYDFKVYSSGIVGFQYRISGVTTWTNAGNATLSGSGTRSYTRSGLTPDTNYEVRARLRYGTTWIYGDIVTFTTGSAADMPIIVTDPVTNVMPASATLNCTFDFKTYLTGSIRLQYRIQGATSWTTARTVTQSGSGSYSYTRSGLLPDSNYEVRAGLRYGTTWMYGSVVSFTTGGAAGMPTIVTDPVTNIQNDRATYNLTYDFSSYISGRVRFRYRVVGTTSWIYCGGANLSGAGTRTYTRTGLLPSTNYEIMAQLRYNTTWISGAMLQFTTLP
ncbi:hypothetical protein ACFL52_00410 [Candidatus Margulisiibacteriota bacterium]